MTGALMAAAFKTPAMKATIDGGSFASGTPTSHGWSNSVSVSGGSGSYTYVWSFTSNSGGTWSFSGATLVGTNVNVSGVSDQANATVICTVTDTVTGRSAISNQASYSYLKNSG